MGTHASSGDDVRAIMDAFRHIVRVLRLSARAAEKQAGVSGAQLFVLQKLADADGLSLRELADRTATDPSSVSVVVSRLAARRLVARRRGARDARRVEVFLTAQGRKLMQRSLPAVQIELLEALQRLPAAKRRTLARTMRTLVEQVGTLARPAMFFEDES